MFNRRKFVPTFDLANLISPEEESLEFDVILEPSDLPDPVVPQLEIFQLCQLQFVSWPGRINLLIYRMKALNDSQFVVDEMQLLQLGQRFEAWIMRN